MTNQYDRKSESETGGKPEKQTVTDPGVKAEPYAEPEPYAAPYAEPEPYAAPYPPKG